MLGCTGGSEARGRGAQETQEQTLTDQIEQYPTAIIEDRYNGVYSGGTWIAIAGRDAEGPGEGYTSCDTGQRCTWTNGDHPARARLALSHTKEGEG